MTTTTSTSVRPDMLKNIDQSTSSASTVILDLGSSYLLIEDIAPIEDDVTHDGGTLISKPKVEIAESVNSLKKGISEKFIQ
jgi:hypothetical protein